MKIRRRKYHSVPSLQMMAMPDLIFTILFFFMLASHMRENTPQLPYEQPEGTQLTKVKKNSSVLDLFVGKNPHTGQYEVQVNNTLVPLHRLPYAIRQERERNGTYSPDQLCASLQADRHTPMYVINQVKRCLREAQILRINYSGKDTHQDSPLP